MTDFQYDADPTAQDAPHRARAQRLANISGGIVSVVLVLGMAVWGWKLMVRDVTGVPVILALDGPVRMAPADPGGDSAAHQGLSVNEVQAVGVAGAPPPQVLLAPGMSVLDEDDMAMAEFAEFAELAELAELAAPTPPAPIEDMTRPLTEAELETAAETEAAGSDLQAPEAAVSAAAIAAIPGDLRPMDARIEQVLDVIAEEDGEGALEEQMAALADTVADGTALLAAGDALAASDALATGDDLAAGDALAALNVPVRSMRPMLRPAGVRLAALEVAAPLTDATPTAAGSIEAAVQAALAEPLAAADTSAAEVAVADLSTGTRLVQLGAYVSEEIAREQWTRIAGGFEAYFAGKRRVIQRAESGGKTFYRLRAEGFADLADAKRFCAALSAGQADCIPVELR